VFVAALDHATQLQHHHIVGDVGDDPEIVSHEEDGS